MRFALWMLALFLALAAPARAQDEETVSVELRVTSSGPGARVSVDRGASDGLALGDTVVFRPREGGTFLGAVREVNERSAVVELFDPAFVPPPGTRGAAEVPRSRLEPSPEPAPEPSPEPAPAEEPAPGAAGPEVPAHEPWQNGDEGYTPDQPLLAHVRPVMPEDRARLYTGRLFLITDHTWFSEDDRSDALWRIGSDLSLENPFGFGGTLDFDVEYDSFEFNVPDADDDDVSELRIDRLSYTYGGTRYENDRLEGGRFLQHAMPEFGYLDGVEWTHRLANGHRFGASFGYMPELDVDFDTGDDLQAAGFYEWRLEGLADVALALGAQKTWHDGRPDRDLVVTRFDYLPREGWDVRGTAWVDFYDSDDDAKDSSVELTQAQVTTGRRWNTGNGVELSYRRLRFPELLRDEFIEPALEELAKNHYDRVAVSGWRNFGADVRAHGSTGLWDDEDESGADVEAGVDLPGPFLPGARADLTLFATRGAFSVDGGARIAYGWPIDEGRWDFAYEIADRHLDDFSHKSDDLWEHALSAIYAVHLAGGWNVSIDGETRYWDEEWAWSLGLYVQKTF